jgi:transcriptional regulator
MDIRGIIYKRVEEMLESGLSKNEINEQLKTWGVRMEVVEIRENSYKIEDHEKKLRLIRTFKSKGVNNKTL